MRRRTTTAAAAAAAASRGASDAGHLPIIRRVKMLGRRQDNDCDPHRGGLSSYRPDGMVGVDGGRFRQFPGFWLEVVAEVDALRSERSPFCGGRIAERSSGGGRRERRQRRWRRRRHIWLL